MAEQQKQQPQITKEPLISFNKQKEIAKINSRIPSTSFNYPQKIIYDTMKRLPILHALNLTANISEIYIQQFWYTTEYSFKCFISCTYLNIYMKVLKN